MATQLEIDYALMAGAAYRSTRSDINRFPVPQGWSEVPLSHVLLPSGFEAVSFTNGSEIVIAYAGTSELEDWLANGGLGFGLGADQLNQAALYYLQVKEANPGATISFTGHSLGGGLASLMGVLFDERAITFDQAPFAQSASIFTQASLVEYLHSKGYSDSRLAMLAPELLSFPFVPYAPRAANVSGYFVQGEALQYLPWVSTIGFQVMLEQNSTGLGLLGPVDLHSQTLLSAFLQSEQSAPEGQSLSDVTFELPDLLKMIFDESLYARSTDRNNRMEENFLDRLIRHEFGNAPGGATDSDMLTRFTSDLWKIAQDGGLTVTDNNLSKALIAFAMQMYYEKTTAADKYLFTAVTGGIRFDFNDVADTLTAAKGYQYFKDYLSSLPKVEREAIAQQLPGLRDWFIQAGSDAMIATAAGQRAFMLGGVGDDNLTGSSLADVLVGNAGADTLIGGAGDDSLLGGAGNDILNGGDGNDIYTIEGEDTIRDSDRKGRIQDKNGKIIAGFIEKRGNESSQSYVFVGDSTITVTKNANLTLTLADGSKITIENFEDGGLGLSIIDNTEGMTGRAEDVDDEWPDTSFSYKMTLTNGGLIDSMAKNEILIGNGGHDFIMGYITDDKIFGGREVDLAGLTSYANFGGAMGTGQRGDWLAGGLGDDSVVGDNGNDVLFGGGGRDLILGGAGDDILNGDDNNLLFPKMYDNTSSPGSNLGWIYFDENGRAIAFESSPLSYLPEWLVTFDPSNSFSITFYDTFIDGNARADGDADIIFGGAGNDRVFGRLGNDQLYGEEGNDLISGGDGDDVIYGGEGNDSLVGEYNGEPLISEGVVNIETINNYVIYHYSTGSS